MNDQLDSITQSLMAWFQANILTWATGIQWLCALVVFGLVLLVWRRLGPHLIRWADDNAPGDLARTILDALIGIGDLVLFIVMAQICAAVFYGLDMSPSVLDAVSNLAVAGIIIRFLSGIISNKAMARAVSAVVWLIVSLRIIGLLTPITDFLHGLSFSMGEIDFTALGAIQGVLLAAVFLQLASMLSRFFTKRIESIEDLSPSLRMLLVKTVKVSLFAVAILLAMSSVGIDLTSLAIFSSALGVGIGFGLKTIISNYIAGILLLLDNSIKPGDTIEAGGVFGVIRDLHGRYTSVLTRDGKEYLIPNEQFMTNEVVNWTFSDTKVRLKVPVGIAYHSDVDLAMKLLEQSADGVKRVLKSPAPAARLMGFGDNAVDLQLRVWIADAEEGVTNVRSEILVNVWNLFHEHDIDFPFPQRDVLLKADSELTVKIDKDGD